MDTPRLLNLGCGKRHHPAWVNMDVVARDPGVIQHDIRAGLPFPEASFDAVYHSHVLEHLPRDEVPGFLAECRRVLKPGGRLRLAVPDLETIARLYLRHLEDARQGVAGARERYDWILLELLDQLVRHESGGDMLRYWQQQPMPAEDYVVERLGSEVREALQAVRQGPPRMGPAERDPLRVGRFRLSGEAHLWMYDSYALSRQLRDAGFEDVAVRGPAESAIPDFAGYGLDTEADGSVRKPDSLFMEATRPQHCEVRTPRAGGGAKARRRPKVVHVCMQDFGGAGNAAARLHEGLLDLGVDSHMYVFHKGTTLPGVHLIPAPQGHRHYPDRHNPAVIRSSALDAAFAWWQTMVAPYPQRSKHIECFSDMSSLADMSTWEHLDDADVLNFHWVAGTMDLHRQGHLLRGKPVVWTLHDMNPITGGCHYAGACQGYATGCGACPMLGSDDAADLSRQILERKARALAELDLTCVTPSHWLSRCVRRSTLLGDRERVVIPNGLRLEVFRPLDKAEVRRQLGIDPKAFVLAFCAANVTNPRKGGVYLLKALEMLARQHPGCRPELVVIGGGAMNLPAGVDFPVHAAGYLHDDRQLALLYTMADAFLLPSMEDNLPNVMLEALACGTPVVGFNVGGIPDGVSHRQTGWLAEPGHAEGFMQGILWAASQGPRAGAIRQACRARAEAEYPLRLQAARYLELYGRLLSTEAAERRAGSAALC